MSRSVIDGAAPLAAEEEVGAAFQVRQRGHHGSVKAGGHCVSADECVDGVQHHPLDIRRQQFAAAWFPARPEQSLQGALACGFGGKQLLGVVGGVWQGDFEWR